MPHPFRKRHIPKKPTPTDNLTALWAMAPTDAAQANVDAFIERMGGAPEVRETRGKAKQGEGNEAAGRRYERLTRDWLKKQGFQVTKSQDSQGAADLVAGRASGTWWCQVKSVSTFTPGCANEAVRELLGLARFKRREIGPYQWLVAVVWMRGSTLEDGPLVVLKIDHKHRIRVSGEPAVEVAKEIERMLEAWGWRE